MSTTAETAARGGEPTAERPAPPVSVLLPAWNEGRMLERCLASLLAIAEPPIEIVLCAGGDDGTPAIAARIAAANPDRIVLLRQEAGEGKQAALRRCLARARGEVLYLTDADCVVPAATLRAMVAAVALPGVAAATGPADPAPEQRDDPWIRHQWATVRAVDRDRQPEATGLLGRNCAVRREAVDAAGGFREPVPIGTDYHLAKSLLAGGRRIRWLPAPVETRYHDRLGPYLRQQSRWLRNILYHGRRFGDRAELAGVARTIAVAWALLLWPLGWRWTRRPGVAAWALLLGAMARARLGRLRALEREAGLAPLGTRRAIAAAARFTLVDLVAWAYPMVDQARRGRRLRW